jgi:hypothetical protein
MSHRIFVLIIATITFGLSSCKSDYTRAVEQGLDSGLVQDSLIFGMRMGQTKKDFYSVCWDLNKQELISEGPGNLTAKYTDPEDSTKDRSLRKEMYFYAIFDEQDTMRGMDMTYHYIAWSPWNRNLFSDFLLEDLKRQYIRDYPGNAYVSIDLDLQEYQAFAKVDGNRQILMYPKDKRQVVVKIEDLRYKLKK